MTAVEGSAVASKVETRRVIHTETHCHVFRVPTDGFWVSNWNYLIVIRTTHKYK
jgi:hypothetical protein